VIVNIEKPQRAWRAGQHALEQAILRPDPFVRLSGKWLVCQLAPHGQARELPLT